MRTLIQFQKFALVGAVATAVQYLVLIALVNFLEVRPVVASSCGYVLSALLNYHLNHRLTFRSERGHASAMPRFFAVSGVGLLLNSAVVWLLSDRISLPYLAAQIVATACVLMWNFFANRKWTF